MCFTKEAERETQRMMRKIQTIITAEHSIVRGGGLGLGESSDDWLGLPDQPLQRVHPALPLQLCSNHLPALPVVLVHPVALQHRNTSNHEESSSTKCSSC